ncbi:MAG: IS110 family transposase [Calditrichota bacterium]
MNTQPLTECYVGIDVSKDHLDVFISNKDQWLQVNNDPDGCRQLGDTLKSLAPQLIVLEGTGGLEKRAAAWLASENLTVAIVNPRQVRRYAQAHNILAKTDRIDAQILAKFAHDVKPKACYVADEERDRLRAWHTRRAQLIKERTQQLNQRARASFPEIIASCDAVIQFLENELASIEKQIDQIIKNNPEYAEKATILKSMKGIGVECARVLLAALPELGRLNRREIASLTGLAPFNNDSGLFHGKRSIQGGRGEIRKILYMATLTAVRFNPVIRNFYNRLKNQGKKEKVARVACMRKMLTILNAMIKNQDAFQPNYA